MLRIVEEATQEWEENLLQKEIIRRIGYDIAKDKVKDAPELTKYHWGLAQVIGFSG